ncbi:uncharacterized protein TRIREDRAFT_122497 [Trichoderma reesei QM6a]|uniref:Predicted protein n=2 Tax=Hypocrea jecorina TaxID=51453 RepID=G0RN14_HYPJQ|nr:uncharacterized protein TRIREDRAFT_122497 [Trichoderma reesei QM6a]EGR47472.1 predicted protein [Trichoderma reesei QM6a]
MPNQRVTRSASTKATAKASSLSPSSPSISSTASTNLTTSRFRVTTSSSPSPRTVVKSNAKTKSRPPPHSKSSSSSSSSSDQPISFPSASAFDQYLLRSGPSTLSGIWLRITKKSSISRFPSVTYHEAVDIALCHGWIDGQRKSLDDISFLQRFTPRRPRSLWSRRNVERVEALTAEGRMRPTGIAAVEAAKEDGRWERAYAGPATMEVPGDFEDALASNEAARAVFEELSKAQRYSFLWRIQTAVKSETRERRIKEFVDLLAEGKTLQSSNARYLVSYLVFRPFVVFVIIIIIIIFILFIILLIISRFNPPVARRAMPRRYKFKPGSQTQPPYICNFILFLFVAVLLLLIVIVIVTSAVVVVAVAVLFIIFFWANMFGFLPRFAILLALPPFFIIIPTIVTLVIAVHDCCTSSALPDGGWFWLGAGKGRRVLIRGVVPITMAVFSVAASVALREVEISNTARVVFKDLIPR